jgi:hypothetical protein
MRAGGTAVRGFLSDHAKATHCRFDQRLGVIRAGLHPLVIGLTVVRSPHRQAVLFLHVGDPAVLHIAPVFLLDVVADLIVCGHFSLFAGTVPALSLHQARHAGRGCCCTGFALYSSS